MISRRAYYGGRPSSGSPKGKNSKSSRSLTRKKNAVLASIIDNLCTGELNQSGEYQTIWTKILVDDKKDDSHLGQLGRMSYAELKDKYGMKRADDYPDGEVEVDAKRFKAECRKAAAKGKRSSSSSSSKSRK